MLVNIHEAKTQLSRLVARAAEGEEIIIGRAGRPVARLVAFNPRQAPRQPGAWAGRMQMSTDFDTTPDSLVDGFEGS